MANNKKYIGQGILPKPGKLFVGTVMLALLVAIPVTLNLSQTQQDIRQEASGNNNKKNNQFKKNKQYRGNKFICKGGPYYCSNTGPTKQCVIVCGTRPSLTPTAYPTYQRTPY